MNSDISKKDRQAVIDGVGEYLVAAMRKALEEATKSCLNCEHFIEGPPDRSGEKCGLNNLTPPPSIAARGCDSWDSEIPF